MKILSLRDPWTFAVLRLGKHIENRVWSNPYRGNFLIHRAKTMTLDEYEGAATFIRRACGHVMPRYNDYRANTVFGCVVGSARIVDCKHNDAILDAEPGAHPWRMRGQFGFELADIKPFDVVVPWRGERGLLEIDMVKFREALAEAREMLKACGVSA